MLEERCINKSLVTVKVSLMLPPVAGVEKTEFSLNLERGEITEVFEELYNLYPQLDPESPKADLTLSNVFWISLNGMMVNFASDSCPGLKSGDEIAIMMPLAGG